MTFKEYKKIHRLGSEENDGIFIGRCFVQEKVDGANTSIWKNEDGTLGMGSRTQDITDGEFNGFTKYVREHEGINKLFADRPKIRLYGEWLVRHTIAYKETSYKQLYLFDIQDEDGKNLSIDEVNKIAAEYNIKTPKLFAVIENPTLEDIKPFVGMSDLGEIGEGVVIKNFDFINKFGDLEYAKVVTDKFKEDNAITFGGNNKHSESYWEMFVVNKYVTLERVQKLMHKIQPTIERRLCIEDTPRIINSAYHDLITEEIWEIQKKVQTLNFRKLSQLSCRKAAQIYHDILSGDVSVADLNK